MKTTTTALINEALSNLERINSIIEELARREFTLEHCNNIRTLRATYKRTEKRLNALIINKHLGV